MRYSAKAKVFWPLLLVVLLADCTTKDIAEAELAPPHTPHVVIGDVVRFTLAYNEGAAFGLSLGRYSRGVLGPVSVGVLALLLAMYARLEPQARWPAVGLAMIAGGAVGNLYDRLWSPLGVVDFIDLGVGSVRFWTFNVADVGITFGAVIFFLAWRDPGPGRLKTG